MAKKRGRPPGKSAGPKTPPICNDERALLRAAKSDLLGTLLGPGLYWLKQIIAEGPPHWDKDESGVRILISGSAQFEWAMNFIADRCGMQRQSAVEVVQPGGFTITVNDVRGGLGWPGMAVGGGDSRDERDRPSVAH